MPISLRKVASYYTSRERFIKLIEGASFHIATPWLLIPILSLLYSKLLIFNDIFPVITDQSNILPRIIGICFGWNLSCAPSIVVFDSRFILRNWDFIQSKYSPWKGDYQDDGNENSEFEQILFSDKTRKNRIDTGQIISGLLILLGIIVILISIVSISRELFTGQDEIIFNKICIAVLGFCLMAIGKKNIHRKVKGINR
ncbi:MAG TPA: hypothetical protein VMF29_03940 [Candidatus Edwardsbacteria bacterium]|nr:hypothetical protein [Candidatus Edwardsbacteria bacterium]